MPTTRKALNYDLDDRILQKHYPNPKSYKNAWKRVKKFLYKKGFESRQYSGVVSHRPMTDAIVQEIILELNDEFEWLGPCVQKFDVTSVGPTYSLDMLFNKEETIAKIDK